MLHGGPAVAAHAMKANSVIAPGKCKEVSPLTGHPKNFAVTAIWTATDAENASQAYVARRKAEAENRRKDLEAMEAAVAKKKKGASGQVSTKKKKVLPSASGKNDASPSKQKASGSAQGN
jgi:hypothetical protein